MRKVVDGKMYNTEKATLVGEYSYGGPGDFERIEEGLYVTQKGNWFLAGEGGAKTQYARQVEQNCWTGGEGITPLTRQEAFEWAQEHLDPDEYEEYFRDLIEEA